MSLHNLGIPDLPLRAFIRKPDGSILPQGGKGSAPPAPDYRAAAEETAAGNLEAAKYATQANRVNQNTPWGSLTWDSNRVFNQEAYDRDLASYNQARADYQSQQSNQGNIYHQQYGYDPYSWGTANNNQAQMSAPVAPNATDYYTGGDQWTQNVTLSPEVQALFDQGMRLERGMFGAQDAALGRVNQTLGQGFDMSSLPDAGMAYDPEMVTNNATELLMRRINPELDRQNEALRAQLANQGITQGSNAYSTAMGQFGQQRNDAATQAALQGILLGMQQQGQTFGQQQQLRNRSLSEQAYLRSLPLNELNALRTGTQVGMPQFPGYAQQATTGGPDMLGAAQGQYGAQMGAYNAQQAGNSGMMSGLLGLGSLGVGAAGAGLFGLGAGNLTGASLAGASWGPTMALSDRRLKRNIRKVGVADNGLSIYSFNYLWSDAKYVGHMADEVEKVVPDAVITLPSGFKAVDYARV